MPCIASWSSWDWDLGIIIRHVRQITVLPWITQPRFFQYSTHTGSHIIVLSVSPFLPLTYLVCWLDGFLRNRKPEIKQIWLTIWQFSGKEQTPIVYFSFQRIISQNGLAATLYGHIFYFNPLIVPFIWIRFFKR